MIEKVIVSAKNKNGIIRQLGTYGRKTGARVGFRKRTPQSNEAFIARRYILWKIKNDTVRFPFSFTHRDNPDFWFEEGEDSYYAEFTEAQSPRSGQLFAEIQGVKSLSEDLGYSISSLMVDEVINDIRSAIIKKSQKQYANSETILIIYPNSPARMGVGLFGNAQNNWNERILTSCYPSGGFRRIFIYWDETNQNFHEALV